MAALEDGGAVAERASVFLVGSGFVKPALTHTQRKLGT